MSDDAAMIAYVGVGLAYVIALLVLAVYGKGHRLVIAEVTFWCAMGVLAVGLLIGEVVR
jgi:hypothetical protein